MIIYYTINLYIFQEVLDIFQEKIDKFYILAPRRVVVLRKTDTVILLASYKRLFSCGALRLCKSKICARGAICARSLVSKLTDSASLDYVAFGSNRSGGLRPHPRWSTTETKMPPVWVAFPWWTIKDSNLGPTGYEPVALTN